MQATYLQKKNITAPHFGKDDILVENYRFNPVHLLDDFESYSEFDFYLDTGTDIYLCRFTAQATQSIEKFPTPHSPIHYLIFKKLSTQTYREHLSQAVSLLKKLQSNTEFQ